MTDTSSFTDALVQEATQKNINGYSDIVQRARAD